MKWLSINELEETTGIPSTTIRRYIQKFNHFFLSRGGARSKKYEEKSVKILLRIKSLFDDGLETEETDRLLRQEFGTVVDSGNSVAETEKPLTPTLATVEDLAEIKELLKQQQEFNKLLVQRLDQQETYIRDSVEKRDQQLTKLLSGYVETAAAKKEKKKFFGIFKKG